MEKALTARVLARTESRRDEWETRIMTTLFIVGVLHMAESVSYIVTLRLTTACGCGQEQNTQLIPEFTRTQGRPATHGELVNHRAIGQ